MTIAAGFVHQGGIILCSDTQQEAGSSKYHGPKAGIIDIPFGKIAFVFAGHTDFAVSAIQACGERLKNVKPEHTVRSMKNVLEKEYIRQVFTPPSDSIDRRYWLLISLWDKETKNCSLWFTQEHSLVSSMEKCRAVGIGTDLANTILKPFMGDFLSEESTLILMAFMMARAKENVTGCGGLSQYIAMNHDGDASSVINISLTEVEKVSSLYDKAAHGLLFSMNTDDDQAYNRAAMNFIQQALAVRENWKRIRQLNPELRNHLGMLGRDREKLDMPE